MDLSFLIPEQVLAMLSDTKVALTLVLFSGLSLLMFGVIYKNLKDIWWTLAGENLHYKGVVRQQENRRMRREKFRNWEHKTGYRNKYRQKNR